MTKYPNLPGVEEYVYDGGARVYINNSLPVALVFGTVTSDSFDDGTPIRFNEPYPIPNSSAITALFSAQSLGKALGDVYKGSNQTVTPVGVRVGYKSTGFDATTVAKSGTDDSEIAAPGATGAVSAIDTEYTGDWNGTVRLDVLTDQTAEDSLAGLTVGVSFDGGNTYEYGLEEVEVTDAENTISMPSIGLKVTLTAGALGDTALSAGDYIEFGVTYGTTPTNNDELYAALQQAYDAVEGYEADYVFSPLAKLGMEVTDATTAAPSGSVDNGEDAANLSFVYQFARFSYNNSTMSRQCIGFIGVQTPSNYGRSYIKTWVDSLSVPDLYKTSTDTMSGEPLTDPEGSYIDMGKNVVVVLGHGQVQGRDGLDDLCNYAGGVIASVGVGQGIVKTVLPQCSLAYDLSLNEANTAVGKRITPLYYDNLVGGNVRIMVGRTAANSSSSFTKVGTMKVVNYTLNALRRIAERYLGKRNSAINRESMKSQMQTVIMRGVESGLYAGGTINVNVGTARSLGTVNVRCVLRPYAEIEDVVIYSTFEQVA